MSENKNTYLSFRKSDTFTFSLEFGLELFMFRLDLFGLGFYLFWLVSGVSLSKIGITYYLCFRKNVIFTFHWSLD